MNSIILVFFKKINKFEKKKLSKLDFLIACREDGLGNCVLNYLNFCRIGKKLNLEVKLYWNKEINKRKEILFGVKNEYSDFSNLNIFKFIDKNKQILKANPRWIYEEKFVIFEEENHLDVLNEICKLAKKLKTQPDIQKRINKIKNKKFKYSYDIRNETMTATKGNIDTKNKYYKWYARDNLSFGKWFPENLILKIIKNITSNNKGKLLLITCDIKFKNKLKKIKNVKMNPLYNSKESGLNQLFLDQKWRQGLDVDLIGSFLLSKYSAKIFEKRNAGKIINISSMYGLIDPDQNIYGKLKKNEGFKPLEYSVAKAGLIGFTKTLAAYYKNSNIDVLCLVFGGINDDQSKKFKKKYSEKIIRNRMLTLQEAVDYISFFSSNKSSYSNGSSVIVDGGATSIL
jgi:NAD(P)-dependent dehydrogenase (short-subunit alcohol dehydrogenase family)